MHGDSLITDSACAIRRIFHGLLAATFAPLTCHPRPARSADSVVVSSLLAYIRRTIISAAFKRCFTSCTYMWLLWYICVTVCAGVLTSTVWWVLHVGNTSAQLCVGTFVLTPRTCRNVLRLRLLSSSKITYFRRCVVLHETCSVEWK